MCTPKRIYRTCLLCLLGRQELCVDFVFFDTQSREYLQPEEA